MSEKSVFINNITAGISIGNFCSYMFLALMGALFMLLVNANKRDPLDARTPLCFSWLFFIKDNFSRLAYAFILVWITIIFSEQILGFKMTPWIAIGIGAGHDQIAKLIIKSMQKSIPKADDSNTDEVK